jgi:hypothetical protein
MSQLRFAWPEQLPWQLAWHAAEHDAMGGVPMQLALQWAPQEPLHSAMQLASPLIEEHWLEHCPSQEAEQLPSQLKLPGLPEQLPMQLPMQLPSQLGSVAVQPPMQPASSIAEHETARFGGVHWASQDAEASTVHVSFPSTTAPPQAESKSARADPAASVTTAPATKARREDQRNMRNLLERNCP